MGSKDAPLPSRVDEPVYTFQDVQQMVHIAAANARLDTALDQLRSARHLLTQARTFIPSDANKIDEATATLVPFHGHIQAIQGALAEITNATIARPFQIRDIERELNVGPWRGGTGPGHLNEPPVPSPNTD